MPTARLDAAKIPYEIRELARRIAVAGGRAWLVGGTVRDMLLGLEPHDFDLATDLEPAAAAAATGSGELADADLGACLVPGLPWPVVLTTLRQEHGYNKGRRPTAVSFCRDPAIDSLRRDFTCNAIYSDCESGELFDPRGGLDDLNKRSLRVIGEPETRFREDPLRLLRMFRFEARLGFRADSACEAGARSTCPSLLSLSGERIFSELTGAFTGVGRGYALRRFVELGFASLLLPEVAAMQGVPQPPQYHPEGDVLTHVCLVLDRLEVPDPRLAWAAVLHDVGKPPTYRVAEDRIRFDGHDVLSARMADEILARLRAPKAFRTDVAAICRDHIRIASLLQMRPRRREAWMRDRMFPLHLAFHRADCLGSHGNLSIHEAASQMLAELPPERPVLVRGSDVLALGVPNGPVVGQLLRAVEEELDAIEEGDPSRTAALEILRRLAQQHVKP